MLVVTLAGGVAPAAGADCVLEPGPTRAVTRVIDGETIALDDGSEVRLVGALAPRSPDSVADQSQWPPEREAKAALERLVHGRSVDLAYSAGRRTDRYGRKLAHVFVHADGRRLWVQAEMLSAGQARAYALPDAAGCLTELVAHERVGRSSGGGLWSHAAYQIRAAMPARELMRYRSTYQIVEGRVRRVAEVRGQVFINLGDDWRLDFAAHIKGGDRRRFQAKEMDLKSLEGRVVRIRGWIERRTGPVIEIHDPAQLEVTDPGQ